MWMVGGVTDRAIDPGEDLAVLVAALPSPLVAASRVTGLPDPTSDAATFRLVLADGSQWKGRRLTSPDHAARMEVLVGTLDDRVFPRVMARRGRATLEPWLEGTAPVAHGDHASVARRIGRILGGVHTTPSPLPVDPAWRSVVDRPARTRARLRALRDAGDLTPREVARLTRGADRLPDRHPISIVHRDLAPENTLLTHDGSLWVIDNAMLDVRVPGYDLARTWHRWPMTARDWAAFLAGYADAGGPAVEAERAWRIDVLAEVIAWRRSVGVGGDGLPLERLRALASA